jgi:plasmid maintenance system antidote protein VapI
MTGPQLLKGWLKRCEYEQQEGAAFLGIHPSLMSMFVRGKRRPPLETAVHIERKTGIPAASWVSSRRDKTTSQVSRKPRKTQKLQVENANVV